MHNLVIITRLIYNYLMLSKLANAVYKVVNKEPINKSSII